MGKNKIPWRILDEDIGYGTRGSTRSGRSSGMLSRQPSSLDERSIEVILTHKPTNISVSSMIESGHYSNSQLQRKKEEIKKQLTGLLEEKVAKALRIPGYQKRQS